MQRKNIFKSIYTYIVIAIIAFLFNTYVLRVGVTTNYVYIKSGLSMIANILAIILPIMALLIYGKVDIETRKIQIAKKGSLRYYFSKFIQLFLFVIATYAISMLGILLYNYKILYSIQIPWTMYLGIVLLAGIYSAVTVFVYEFLISIIGKKAIPLATIVSIILIIIPIQYAANIISMLTTLTFSNIYIDSFNSKAVFITSALSNIVYFLIMVFLGIITVRMTLNNIVYKKVARNNSNRNNKAKDIVLKILLVIIYTVATIMLCVLLTDFRNFYLGVIDVTESKIYKISDDLKEELKNLENDIDIIYSGDDYKEVFLIKEKEIDKITDKVGYINIPYSSDSKSDISKVLDDETIYMKKSGGNESRVYTFKADTDSIIPISEKANEVINILDSQIAEGIRVLNLEDKDATIGYLKINEEKESDTNKIGGFDFLKETIRQKGRILKDVTLESIDDIKDMKAILIVEQSRDLKDSELSILKEYMKMGGNFLVFRAPTDDGKVQANFDKLLSEFALKIPMDNVIFDLGEKRRLELITTAENTDLESGNTSDEKFNISYDNAVIFPAANKENSFNDIIRLRYPNSLVALLFNGCIEVMEDKKLELGVETQNIFETSEDAILLDEYTAEDMTKTNPENGKKGKYSLAEISTKKISDSISSKMIAFSSKFMLSSYPYARLMGSNDPMCKMQGSQDIITAALKTITFDNDKDNEKYNVVPKKEVLDAFYLNDNADDPQKIYDGISRNIVVYSIIVFLLGLIIVIVTNVENNIFRNIIIAKKKVIVTSEDDSKESNKEK